MAQRVSNKPGLSYIPDDHVVCLVERLCIPVSLECNDLNIPTYAGAGPQSRVSYHSYILYISAYVPDGPSDLSRVLVHLGQFCWPMQMSVKPTMDAVEEVIYLLHA